MTKGGASVAPDSMARLHSLRAGFHRHVPKPVRPDEPAEIVAGLAGRR